ncbi:glycosyltransferase family 2 protein [Lachnospiraceae bacterium]|nr:glycosyltransferase family 2 protein [Lachnospiraceae bacterium]
MRKVAAVICNYNKKDYVAECIQSVTESVFQDFDIIAVDNASTDGSAECIRTRFGEKVKMLVNEENLGGSGGFNRGIRYALEQGYEYIWCLDNDVLVDENALGELYIFLEEHPEVGMAGSKVYHMEKPDYVQQFGIDIVWEEYCCEAKYSGQREDGSMPEVVYSDAVAACSVLVRASVIREIGMLPEENFLYWDDTEWGLRCNLAGYKVASLGSSKILHSMGAKKEAVNTFPLYYAWRNWIRFFMKYTPKEKREDMCTAFLEGLFDVVYNDLYLGEENRTRTVMYAYDDAIHGRMGKAEEYKIFPVIHSEEKLIKLLKGKNAVKIYANGQEEQAEEFAEKLREMGRRTGDCFLPRILEGKPLSGEDSFTMAKDIFSLDDFRLSTWYVDKEGRILSSEEDVFLVINREYSRKTFVFSQKGLFMSFTDKIF